ncbi:MAG: hypothetical protein ACLQJR_09995 [Stellaceae bacterium]
MSQDDILAILRHVLTTAGGALVTDGVLSSSQLQDGVGAVIVIAGIAWSLANKYQHRRALAAAKSA